MGLICSISLRLIPLPSGYVLQNMLSFENPSEFLIGTVKVILPTVTI